MNSIIELAHALGEQIAKSEQIRNLEAAKSAYESNKSLQEKLSEYKAEQNLLAAEFSKEADEQDAKVIADVKARMEELSRDVVVDPCYVAFAEAQQAMNDLMRDVNDEIKFCITGERPVHCTHDCSTCGGCH